MLYKFALPAENRAAWSGPQRFSTPPRLGKSGHACPIKNSLVGEPPSLHIHNTEAHKPESPLTPQTAVASRQPQPGPGALGLSCTPRNRTSLLQSPSTQAPTAGPPRSQPLPEPPSIPIQASALVLTAAHPPLAPPPPNPPPSPPQRCSTLYVRIMRPCVARRSRGPDPGAARRSRSAWGRVRVRVCFEGRGRWGPGWLLLQERFCWSGTEEDRSTKSAGRGGGRACEA